MASMSQLWILFLLFLFFFSSLPLSFSQSNSLQNIETFFPLAIPPPPVITSPPTIPQTPTTITSPPTIPPSPSSNSKVGTAIGVTAASTLVIAGVFFFFLQRYINARRRRKISNNPPVILNHNEAATPPVEAKSFDGTLKGLIVDENGLDVLYWRKLEAGQLKTSFRKDILSKAFDEEQRRSRGSRKERRTRPESLIHEIPLLRGKSSSSQFDPELHETSSSQFDPEIHETYHLPMAPSTPQRNIEIFKQSSNKFLNTPPKPLLSSPPHPPAPSAPPPPPPPAPSAPPPPTPPAPPAPPPPRAPPPPMIPVKKIAAPPPPPPPKKSSGPPPPPPIRIGGMSSSSAKPPSIPKLKSTGSRLAESSSTEIMNDIPGGHTKLKPLHWDKVTANADHSMVWDKISDGSFRFDDDLMEALFGYVATNRKSPDKTKKSSLGTSSNPAQIFILDPRKSQNTAIVLRSLAVSRQEILDSLLQGQGLNADNLEKLARIAPTKEEEEQILAFDGNPTKLADAESFLFHILKAVPSPFARINAMLFRSNYDPEILHLKQSVQTLEMGCQELRTRGLLLKLLEAILKAGNRMNAGTSRGNAHAFNLTALRKLSDVKSSDGKTTLLHFVVEEVVRYEGKRSVINRNYSLSRSNSRSSNASASSSDKTTTKEKENEYMMLGLPSVGGLSVEFSNVKKAASIDYDTFVNTSSTLKHRVDDIRQLLSGIDVSKGSGFVREMKGIIEEAEDELKVVQEEQTRVMELVKKTNEYYQAGASKDKSKHPFQIFVIIKDFLSMVDQVCVDIARNLQKKKTEKPSGGSSSPPYPVSRGAVRFPNLPPHFLSDKSRTSSSESDDDF